MYPPTPLVGVAILVARDGAVLLVKRAFPPNAGRWSLPGGHVELGEPLKEAARREVAEECGIDVEVGELLDV
ncbi:MAG: NUDIX domain-containing protein, partial [Calditrichaeota bacterium]|nr:NUDIX domain-containing protein [Calditrichota bacterium]